MKTGIIKLTAACLILFLSILAPAQTGGNFTITESVIAGGGGTNSSGGDFSLAGTIGQSVAGNELTGGSFAVTSGFWNFTPSTPVAIGFEGDLTPRATNGDGLIQSTDTIQVQRFEIGLDPTLSNEFQRADTAPIGTRGNGMINSADTIQTQRYEIGLDAAQQAGGPTAPSPPPPATEQTAAETLSPDKPDGVNTRQLRVQSRFANTGQSVVVNILVDALGDESGYGFTLTYNNAILQNPDVMIGGAGGSRFCNTMTAPGQIFCSVRDFPNNNPSSTTGQIGEIAAGVNQILVRITFSVPMNAPAGATALTFTNVNASNDAAQSLTITSQSGTVTITGPTAASASLGGRVLTSAGRGLMNATVSLTDQSGNTRTTQTSTFGYYRFEDVAVGQNYIISVRSKRYQFTPQVVTVTEDIVQLNFVAQ